MSGQVVAWYRKLSRTNTPTFYDRLCDFWEILLTSYLLCYCRIFSVPSWLSYSHNEGNRNPISVLSNLVNTWNFTRRTWKWNSYPPGHAVCWAWQTTCFCYASCSLGLYNAVISLSLTHKLGGVEVDESAGILSVKVSDRTTSKFHFKDGILLSTLCTTTADNSKFT